MKAISVVSPTNYSPTNENDELRISTTTGWKRNGEKVNENYLPEQI